MHFKFCFQIWIICWDKNNCLMKKLHSSSRCIFESWIKQILFGGSLNFLYIDKWYMWWISSFIFGKIRIGMFAECLTPVALHVMCCYFGMWTRHWPLLNDDSSKKEGKNVGGAPWSLGHWNILTRFFPFDKFLSK